MPKQKGSRQRKQASINISNYLRQKREKKISDGDDGGGVGDNGVGDGDDGARVDVGETSAPLQLPSDEEFSFSREDDAFNSSADDAFNSSADCVTADQPSTSSATIISGMFYKVPPPDFYVSRGPYWQDDDEDFQLRLSDEEEEEEEEVEVVEGVVEDEEENKSHETYGGKFSGVEIRNKYLGSFLHEKKEEIRKFNETNENEILTVERERIEQGFSRFSCDTCGEKGKVKIVKYGFDCDIVVTCKCEEPFFESKYTRVQSGAEGVVTSSMGVATASIVYQNILNGGGIAALNNTSMAMGHKALANSTHQRYKKYIEKFTEAKYKESMKEVDKAVFRFYEEVKGVTPDSDGILDIDAVYDGTWMKRGHTSPIGMGIVTEAYTGYVLDAQIYSKLCNICSSMASRMKKEEFEKAYETHVESGRCKKNFFEASGNMDAAGAVACWGRSLGRKFRYKVFVGDGDSSAHKAVCAMNNGSGPYGDEHPVAKEECVNHVQKRMVARLFDLRKKYNDPVKTKTGRMLFRSKIGGKNKLSDNTVHKIGKY